MGNVAFMPKGDVFESSLGVGPHDPRKAADLLAGDGVLFVRHSRRTLLAFGEILAGFTDFGALQVANFEGDLFEARSEGGEGRDEIRMAVALDDLRGDGRGAQTEARADLHF